MMEGWMDGWMDGWLADIFGYQLGALSWVFNLFKLAN